jgi:hypothetical protein
VLLQVSVAYACDTCYDVELAEPGEAEPGGPDEGGGDDTSLEAHQQQQQQGLQQQQSMQQQGGQRDEPQGEPTAAADLPRAVSAGGQAASHRDPPVLLQSAAADQPAGIIISSSSPADSPSKPRVHDRQQAPPAGSEASQDNVAAGGARSASAAGARGSPVGQPAQLCVRVIRACGLQVGLRVGGGGKVGFLGGMKRGV